jgi:hypothetical protein
MTVFFALVLAFSLGAARYFRAIPAANAGNAACWVFVAAVSDASGHGWAGLLAATMAVFFASRCAAAIRARKASSSRQNGVGQ